MALLLLMTNIGVLRETAAVVIAARDRAPQCHRRCLSKHLFVRSRKPPQLEESVARGDAGDGGLPADGGAQLAPHFVQPFADHVALRAQSAEFVERVAKTAFADAYYATKIGDRNRRADI